MRLFTNRLVSGPVISVAILVITAAEPVMATPKVTLQGKVQVGGSSALSLSVIKKNGAVLAQKTLSTSGKFSFKITPSAFKDSSLVVTENGRLKGFVFLNKFSSTKLGQFFAAVSSRTKKIDLKTILDKNGYYLVQKLPSTSLVNTSKKATA